MVKSSFLMVNVKSSFLMVKSHLWWLYCVKFPFLMVESLFLMATRHSCGLRSSIFFLVQSPFLLVKVEIFTHVGQVPSDLWFKKSLVHGEVPICWWRSPNLLMVKPPFLMVKSLFLMVQSPFVGEVCRSNGLYRWSYGSRLGHRLRRGTGGGAAGDCCGDLHRGQCHRQRGAHRIPGGFNGWTISGSLQKVRQTFAIELGSQDLDHGS